MTEAELLALRTVLADRRGELLDRLAIAAAGDGRIVNAGFLRLLADLQTAITAVDAQMNVELEAELKEV